MPPKSNRRDVFDPASDNFLKEEFPFYWVARVHGRYKDLMDKALKRIGLDSLRWRVLSILKEQKEMTVSEVSEYAVIRLPTTTKLIYRMQEEGLINIKTAENDGRVKLLSLTEKGTERWQDAYQAANKLFVKSFDGIPMPTLRKLNITLEAILNNLQ